MIVKQAEFIKSGTKIEHLPTDNLPEFMFCGRSNVGKSSFINALLNRKNLAHPSATPGKTQTLNMYLVNKELYFVDVPGYGYAKVNKKMIEEFGIMIDEYLKCRVPLKMVFLLVDFRHDPTEDDILMYNYIKYFNRKVCVICTKRDKVKKSMYVKNLKRIKECLNFDPNDLIIVTSSEEKVGINETLSIIESQL